MIIEDKTARGRRRRSAAGAAIWCASKARTIEDILALGDGREHEQAFETVARISEINEGLYDTFVGPWVQDVEQRGHAPRRCA